jgi:hypothetical protein
MSLCGVRLICVLCIQYNTSEYGREEEEEEEAREEDEVSRGAGPRSSRHLIGCAMGWRVQQHEVASSYIIYDMPSEPPVYLVWQDVLPSRLAGPITASQISLVPQPWLGQARAVSRSYQQRPVDNTRFGRLDGNRRLLTCAELSVGSLGKRVDERSRWEAQHGPQPCRLALPYQPSPTACMA